MRASGRGGRQGPRGDPVPPRALLAFMGHLCARPVLRSGGAFSCARAASVFGGAFSCARVSSAVWGIMNGYESTFALTSP